MSPGDAHLDRLHAAPLGEFVRVRDALAAELRARGQRAASHAVKALRRPPAPVWAVNQLARRDRVGLERLLRAVDRVRAAQLGADAGVSLARATAEYRDVLQTLSRQAAAFLREAGQPASGRALERIGSTLLGAAADDELRSRLRHGRLLAEVTPRGFAVFGDRLPRRPRPAAGAASRPAGGRPTAAAPDVARRRAERGRLEEELARRRGAAAELRRRREVAEREAGARRREAEDAETAARAARGRADDLAARLAEAERAVSELEARLSRLPAERAPGR